MNNFSINPLPGPGRLKGSQPEMWLPWIQSLGGTASDYLANNICIFLPELTLDFSHFFINWFVSVSFDSLVLVLVEMTLHVWFCAEICSAETNSWLLQHLPTCLCLLCLPRGRGRSANILFLKTFSWCFFYDVAFGKGLNFQVPRLPPSIKHRTDSCLTLM